MRSHLLLISCALGVAAGAAAAEKFGVIPGVECDREARLCSDERGPSVGLTRLYLGDEAADHLLATLEALDASARPRASSPGPVAESEPAPPRVRRPRTGVACDDGVETCYAAKGPHAGMTKAQYGSAAAAALARRAKLPPDADDAIVRPSLREVCDRAAEACYRDGAADPGLTELHFGPGAAASLAARAD